MLIKLKIISVYFGGVVKKLVVFSNDEFFKRTACVINVELLIMIGSIFVWRQKQNITRTMMKFGKYLRAKKFYKHVIRWCSFS